MDIFGWWRWKDYTSHQINSIGDNHSTKHWGYLIGPGETPTPADVDGDTDDEEEGDDGHRKILKQVNFPPEIERGDVNPSGLVTKVSKAIQKRLTRLDVHKDKLESVENKTEIQSKFLYLNCFGFWFLFEGSFQPLISSICFPGGCKEVWHEIDQRCLFQQPRLLDKVKDLHKSLSADDEKMTDEYSKGLVDGFTKQLLACNFPSPPAWVPGFSFRGPRKVCGLSLKMLASGACLNCWRWAGLVLETHLKGAKGMKSPNTISWMYSHIVGFGGPVKFCFFVSKRAATTLIHFSSHNKLPSTFKRFPL